MIGTAVFAYGLLSSFVLSAIDRNCRHGRPNPPAVELSGWALMSLSLTLAVALPAACLLQPALD